MSADKLCDENEADTAPTRPAVSSESALSLVQSVCYLLGTLCFLAGSLLFLPVIDDAFLPLGGVLFTAGSALFVFIDASQLCALVVTITPRERRNKSVLVTATVSLGGSLLFLVGSFFFISPRTVAMGTAIFIVGCAIFVSLSVLQVNRLRSASQRERDSERDCVRDSESCESVCESVPESVSVSMPVCNSKANESGPLFVALAAGLGAALFLVGSVLYLPLWPAGLFDWPACVLFITGSASYTASALLQMHDGLFPKQLVKR